MCHNMCMYTYTYMCVSVYMWIYINVWVCVCMYICIIYQLQKSRSVAILQSRYLEIWKMYYHNLESDSDITTTKNYTCIVIHNLMFTLSLLCIAICGLPLYIYLCRHTFCWCLTDWLWEIVHFNFYITRTFISCRLLFFRSFTCPLYVLYYELKK